MSTGQREMGGGSGEPAALSLLSAGRMPQSMLISICLGFASGERGRINVSTPSL